MLTKEQIKAIETAKGRVLVNAGPGTGKTTVLTQRIIHLINKGADESMIHAFTFTNKATREMENRLDYHLKREHNVGISNFHQYTYGHLRMEMEDSEVLSETSQKTIIKNLILERNFKELEVKETLKQISRVKNGLPLEQKVMSKRLKIIEIYYAYEEYLATNNKLDFDSMNLLFLRKLQLDPYFREMIKEEFEHILVDEAQDINNIQYEILKIMTEGSHNLFMVGDPNQSIYSFRGADPKILYKFTKEFDVEVLHLTINHRSTKSLVNATNSLIANNHNEFNVPLVSNNEEGTKPIYKKFQYTTHAARYTAELIKNSVEKGLYKYGDHAILFRLNESRGLYEHQLSKYGIPHYLSGVGFLEYKEIKYILSYYKIVLNHNDNEAFTNICNWPKRGIADVLMSKIRLMAVTTKQSYYECAKALNDELLNKFIEIIEDLTYKFQHFNHEDFFDEVVKIIEVRKISKNLSDEKRRYNNISALKQMFIEFYEERNEPFQTLINELTMAAKPEYGNDFVKLMSIHQSKGLEAKVVIIVDVRDETMPGLQRGSDLEEERRVFYVACTRTKEMLYVLATEKNGPNDLHRNVESRFIKELYN